jgi:RimJ/RimL family protein N-acetyltransferase
MPGMGSMDAIEAVISYLKTDPLKHVVHLKMLDAYGGHIRCHYEQDGAQAAILLLLPTGVSAYDARTYPQTDFVVLPVGSDGGTVRRVIRQVPWERSLVFKFADALTRDAVLQDHPLERTRAFFSYTSHDPFFQPQPSVTLSGELDEKVIPFYRENGYTPDELDGYFRQGALSFTVYEQGEPLSTCMVFRNYGDIWEIGGVYTPPAQRRKGYARLTVETALHALLTRGRVPRYNVLEGNTASIRLAESLGMQRFVTVEHFIHSAL